jgi:hypothetical protein
MFSTFLTLLTVTFCREVNTSDSPVSALCQLSETAELFLFRRSASVAKCLNHASRSLYIDYFGLHIFLMTPFCSLST